MATFFLGLLAGAALGIVLLAVLNMTGKDEWP